VRRSAVTALGYIGGEKARNFLLLALRKEADRGVKQMMQNQLKWKYKNDPVVQAFLEKFGKLPSVVKKKLPAKKLPVEKLSLKKAKKDLKKQGKIIFEQKDTLNKDITWLGLKEKFIASFNEKTGKLIDYNKKLQDLEEDEKPSATCLLSVKDKTWVGTDSGLFEINQGKVVQLAINFEIINCQVKSLKALPNGAGIKVETDKGAFNYYFRENKWEKNNR